MFDTKALITAVKMRPILYDTKCDSYSDKHGRVNAWIEICREIYHDWEVVSSEERNKRGRDIQTKWKSLRDNFMREQKVQTKVKAGLLVPKRKKYVYYDDLLFLQPGFNHRRSLSKFRKSLVHDSCKTSSRANEVAVEVATSSGTFIDSKMHPVSSEEAQQIPDDKLIEMLTSSILQSEQEEAEDKLGNRHFLLSLLPLMRKLSDEANVAVRIQLLDVVRRALVNQHLTSLSAKD